jgi:predicted  nucleic acid-binding Zn-ribbon protein
VSLASDDSIPEPETGPEPFCYESAEDRDDVYPTPAATDGTADEQNNCDWEYVGDDCHDCHATGQAPSDGTAQHAHDPDASGQDGGEPNVSGQDSSGWDGAGQHNGDATGQEGAWNRGPSGQEWCTPAVSGQDTFAFDVLGRDAWEMEGPPHTWSTTGQDAWNIVGHDTNQVAELTWQNVDLTAQIVDLKERESRAQATANELSQFMSQMRADQYAERNALRHNTEMALADAAFLRRDLERMEQKLDAATEDLAAVLDGSDVQSEELVAVRHQLAAARAEVEWQRQQLAEMSGDVEHAFEQKKAAEARLKEVERALEMVSRDRDRANNFISQLGEENQRIKKKLREANQDAVDKAVQTCQHCFRIVLRPKEAATGSETPTPNPQQDNADCITVMRAEVVAAVREELRSRLHSAEEMRDTLNRLEAAVSQLEDFNDECEDAADDVDDELDAAIEGYEENNQRLEENVERLETGYEKHNRRLESTSQKLKDNAHRLEKTAGNLQGTLNSFQELAMEMQLQMPRSRGWRSHIEASNSPNNRAGWI